jgi:hypothetical protein
MRIAIFGAGGIGGYPKREKKSSLSRGEDTYKRSVTTA